jgi:Fe-S-cluster-containing hydrogenase component 2
MVAKVDKETCVGCGTCVDACPEAAIELVDEIAVVDEDRCQECGDCQEACPTESIKVEKTGKSKKDE